MASSRLLTKILADFLFGFYLLNWVLENATNHTQHVGNKLKNETRIEHIAFDFNFDFV